MEFNITDKSNRSLLEIRVSFHGELLREFFFSRGGIWRYLYLGASSLVFLSFFSGLHCVWPHYFPEIPLYPAVVFVSLLSLRFSLLPALLLSLPAGIMLDAALCQPLGTHVVLLSLSSFAASLAAERYPLRETLIAGLACSCAMGTTTFVLAQLLFFAGGLSYTERLALLPKYLLLALPVNALAAGPVFFAIMSFSERIFSRPKDV
jgi:hypothetical protein